MLVKDVLLSVRFGLDDAECSKYSDIEIIDSMNSVVSYINSALINRRSSLARKKATITPVDGAATLPLDFVSMCDFEEDGITLDSYVMVGDKIYTDAAMSIIYYYSFAAVNNLEETVPLPNYLKELLVRFTEAFVTKSIGKDAFPQIIYEEVSKTITGRDYPYITRDIPFTI